MKENATTYTSTTETLDRALNGEFDPEFTAYRNAHPELAELRKNMTKDEKIEYLLSLLDELGLAKEETPEEKAERQHFEQIEELLKICDKSLTVGRMTTVRDIEQTYLKLNKDKKENDGNWAYCCLLSSIYECGRIQGIRSERARRRGEQV